MLRVGARSQRAAVLIRNARRNVVIPGAKDLRARRKRSKDGKPSQVLELDLDSVDFSNEKDVKFKVNQLKEFTRNLREQMRYTEELKRKHQVEKELESAVKSGKTHGEELGIDDADLIYSGMAPGSDGHVKARELPSEDNLSALLLQAPEGNKPLLPEVLAERIGDKNLILRCLFDKRNRDFNPIINALYHSKERLNGVGITTIYKTILNRNSKTLEFGSLVQLDEMIMESVNNDATKLNQDIYEHLMIPFSRTKTASPTNKLEVCAKLRELTERMDLTLEEKTFQPSQYMLNECIFAAYKAQSWDYMEFFLKKFTKDYSLQPNRKNYTTVISFYNTVGQYKKAWQLFDSLKFLSLEHKPDTRVYNLMFDVCRKEKNYARALDLFQEMDDLDVKKDIKSYLNVASALAASSTDNIVSEGKASSLRLMSWKYIHKIYDDPQLSQQLIDDPRNNMKLLETMMTVSAYDGDVGISRALYYKYTNALFKLYYTEFKKYHHDDEPVDYIAIWKKALAPQMFNLLLVAYSKFKRSELPVLMGYPEGSKLRRNIIYSVDYIGRNAYSSDSSVKLPMLPMLELQDPGLIMNESKALWRFNLEYGGSLDIRQLPEGLKTIEDLEKLAKEANSVEEYKLQISQRLFEWKTKFVNQKVLNMRNLITFLTIPIRLNEPQEFKLRLQEFTFQPFEFNELVESEFSKIKEKQQIQSPLPSEKLSDSTELTQNLTTPSEFLLYLVSMKHKLPANCAIYEIAMKAAISFHDYELAMKTWKARGRFRTTDAFQNLPAAERQKSDAMFVQLMVEYFSNEKMFTDALSIVLSSLKTVDWKYPMVKSLHKALLEVEDFNSVDKLLSVVNRKSKLAKLEEEIKSLDI